MKIKKMIIIVSTSAIMLGSGVASAFNPAAYPGKSIAVQGQTIPIAQCSLTGPGALVCAGIALGVNEVLNALNGKKAFGPNGEGIKAINTVANDLKNGPGENNDIVGRNGWLRKRLGF